jgi:hypothetical protein
MNREIRPGEFYRHFKNKLYQIVAIATHSETGEKMVVYQALYGDFQTYVRPYEMFAGEVDHEKYPQVQQKYRFERVTLKSETGTAGENADSSRDSGNAAGYSRKNVEPAAEEPIAEEPGPNADLLAFLDTDDYQTRLACLKRLEATATQADLDSICLVLDIQPQRGDRYMQIAGIRQYLSTQNRYNGKHLR